MKRDRKTHKRILMTLGIIGTMVLGIGIGSMTHALAKTAPSRWMITPAKATITVGKTTKSKVYRLRASGKRTKLSVSGVTWKSSDKKKATVNKKGVVTAKKKGRVTIYATYKYKNAAKKKTKRSYKLTIVNKVTSTTANVANTAKPGQSSNTSVSTDTHATATSVPTVTNVPTQNPVNPVVTPVPLPDRTAPPIEGDIVYSGAYKQVVWTLDNKGYLYVEGDGMVKDGDRVLWEDYKDSIVSAKLKLSNATDLSFVFQGYPNLETLDLSEVDASKLQVLMHMASLNDKLKEINMAGWDVSSLTEMFQTFWRDEALESINMSGWNASKLTSMYEAFYGCSKLTNLNLEGFKAPVIGNMSGTFYDCSSLETLDITVFDTSHVSSFSETFSGCSSLKELDVSGFDTRNASDMRHMFDGCSQLEELDVSGFDTSNVGSFRGMFDGCSSLKALDVSGFVTGQVAYFAAMFNGCSLLEEIDVSGFDTTNAFSFSMMFRDCVSLKSVDVSGFDTSGVYDFSEMFFRCRALESVDISRFVTNEAEYFSIISGCDKLTSLDFSSFEIMAPDEVKILLFSNDNTTTIKTPKFVGNHIILLDGVWVDANGREYTQIDPQMNESIVLTRVS